MFSLWHACQERDPPQFIETVIFLNCESRDDNDNGVKSAAFRNDGDGGGKEKTIIDETDERRTVFFEHHDWGTLFRDL